MKRILNLFIVSTLLLSFFSSCDKEDEDTNTPNATDNNFMTMASYTNNAEINFGQLALSKSTNDSVRAFAQMMITEHTLTGSGLDSLASEYVYTNLPDSIEPAHAALRSQLDALSGYDFDTAYINGQIRDHQIAVDLFQDEVSNGRATNIKSFASRMLPNLNMHLQMADSVSSNF
jgi:putative membrane protein